MPEVTPVLVPRINVNDDWAVIVAWRVSNGQQVAAATLVATLETSKITFDVHAERAGYVFYTHAQKSVVAAGSPLAWISDTPTAPDMQSPTGAAAPAPAADSRFTRKALRLMAQVGLTADDFPGIGRVEVAEVERVARARGGAPSAELDDTEPLEQSASKVIEATRLAEVYRSVVPSLVTVSVSSESVRRKLKAIAADFGPVSLLEFTIHEVAQLLAGFAELNGFFADGRAWRHRQVAIGFAVNAGRSLKVPVIRNAAALSQLEVCRALRDLSLRYFRDELVMQDLAGGSFTVTDLSDHGVTHFIPVLNDRQSAILGLCAERPGTQHFDLVLAFDHRIADGMRAAEFLRDLRARLEA